jgi:hypothetical protein
VDGFNQDETASKCHEGTVAFGGLLASQGDALEAFQLADGLLDARAGSVEHFREESGLVFCVGAVRDDRDDATLSTSCAVGGGIVAFVRQGCARRDVRPDVERDFELDAVVRLAAGQMEGNGQAVEVRLEVDFAREAAP